MRPLVLSVKRSKFRFDDANSVESDAVYKKMKPEILRAKNHACEFCGFASKKWQHIHHLDDNHENNERDNLVVACPICHMCCHIGFSGERGMGTLIYLDPALDITQAELNNVVRMLWIGSMAKGDIATQSEKMLERLYNQTSNARRILKTNDLFVLGDFLMGLSDKDYAARADKLKGMYFLPFREGFAKELKYWATENNLVHPNKWVSIADKKFDLIYEIQD